MWVWWDPTEQARPPCSTPVSYTHLDVYKRQETDYEEALNHYMYTDPSQAAEFVEKTGIDSLAVAIGNQHGAYTAPPRINFEILEKVRGDVSLSLIHI